MSPGAWPLVRLTVGNRAALPTWTFLVSHGRAERQAVQKVPVPEDSSFSHTHTLGSSAMQEGVWDEHLRKDWNITDEKRLLGSRWRP